MTLTTMRVITLVQPEVKPRQHRRDMWGSLRMIMSQNVSRNRAKMGVTIMFLYEIRETALRKKT